MIRSAMKMPLLEREQEHDLAVRWKDLQDQQAMHQIVMSHMRLVISMASKFRQFALPVNDLIQEGHIGLLEAASRFEPDRDVRFSTYATWWIRQSVERAVMNQGRVIRLPIHVMRELQQVLRARRTLENDPAFIATRPDGVRVEDIAALLGQDVHEVSDLLAMAEVPRSLDAEVGRFDEEWTLGDSMADTLTVDPGGVTQTHEVERLLESWIDALTNREKEVLEGRFGLHDREPETLEILSDRLGLTRERVRQIQNEALLKLRRHLVRKGISRDAVL